MSLKYQLTHFYLLTSKYVLLGCLFLIITFVFHLIGFASPYWFYIDSEFGQDFSKIHFGLWTICTETKIASNCVQHNNISSIFQAAQAMECLGFIMIIASAVCIILYLFVIEDSKPLLRATVACAYSAAFFILLGGIFFATDVLGNNHSYGIIHVSFAFSIIGAITSMAAGVMFVLDNRRVLTI